MITKNIERCPTCGRIINERSVPLSATMVIALWRVFLHCKNVGRHEFTRQEIDPLLSKGTQYANFGYWKWWSSGMVYTPTINGKTGRGYWGFNLERLEEFFAGKREVFSIIWTKGKGKNRQTKAESPLTIDQIPDISKFMKDDDYIVRYREPQTKMF